MSSKCVCDRHFCSMLIGELCSFVHALRTTQKITKRGYTAYPASHSADWLLCIAGLGLVYRGGGSSCCISPGQLLLTVTLDTAQKLIVFSKPCATSQYGLPQCKRHIKLSGKYRALACSWAITNINAHLLSNTFLTFLTTRDAMSRDVGTQRGN